MSLQKFDTDFLINQLNIFIPKDFDVVLAVNQEDRAALMQRSDGKLVAYRYNYSYIGNSKNEDNLEFYFSGAVAESRVLTNLMFPHMADIISHSELVYEGVSL